jgi:hypothetical protein
MTWQARFLFIVVMAFAVLTPAIRASSNADSGSTHNQVLVDIYRGYLIVAPVDVGKFQGLRFLLDTGTTNTVIDRRLAKPLGLVGRPRKVLNFNKLITVECAELPEIAFGPDVANHLPVLLEDLRYLQTGQGSVDGILGLDLLRQRNFLVDYAESRVVFGTTETTDMQAVPMRMTQTLLSVEAQLNGRPVWMIADTGLLRTMIYERGLEALLENDRIQGHVRSQSMGGWVENRVSTVLQFRLGAQDLEREVLFVPAPAANRLDEVAGFLGPASLKAKQVLFDFDAHQLRWKP